MRLLQYMLEKMGLRTNKEEANPREILYFGDIHDEEEEKKIAGQQG